MPKRSHKILVVEPDPDTLEILVASLARRFNAHVTCVGDAESCLDIEVVEPHDLVIAELDLKDSSGLQLAEQLLALNARPVVLLGVEPTTDDVITAMRLGVRDFFRKPFPVGELLGCIDRLLCGHDVRRQHMAKYRRMRELVRRVIRERREINRRTELVCRDLVGAHRRLVHRIVEFEEARAGPGK